MVTITKSPLEVPIPRPVTISDFEAALVEMLGAADAAGESFLDVTANALSRKVNGAGGRAKGRALCCRLMRRMMIPGDHELSASHSANSTALLIRYRVPR